MIQHPDRFLSLDHSPYPNYSFSGPNLSSDPNTGIFLEDRYYDKTDAAVVFKHIDWRTGRERYIYHGNDGTNMPWNDTAQIDYLNPEAREAVIQTILAVARKFPVIRFDAAMTLAKRHIQRLWFPEPGSGGAIPSRSEYGITNEAFDKAMPIEFWREVVDRVASEVPGTLLLAEAFWMMEGYFVRTLGMHRVYNSAFMNMMRDEENAKYRQVMKNTLAFDPEILKRFVNFMNNPDEETASEQFGDGDKYFAVSTLMVTMPGLPMFGHGQIEGFREKYGMEYRRAVWNETPNEGLVAHHERIIFPLLRKRGIFAEVTNFLMYDALTPEGNVIEDIFAYSNLSGEERSLVIIYNKYARTLANIKMPIRYPNTPNSFTSLGESLGLTPAGDHYVTYRDNITGFEYIRRSLDIYEHGLTFNLREYAHHVLLDFREVVDDASGKYRRLHDYLNGRGVYSVEAVLQEVLLQPVMAPFETLLRVPLAEETDGAKSTSIELLTGMTELFEKAAAFTDREATIETLVAAVVEKINIVLSLPSISEAYPYPRSKKYSEIEEKFGTIFSEAAANIVVQGWLFTQDLGKIYGSENYWLRSRSWIDEWLYARLLGELFREKNIENHDAWISLIKTIVSSPPERFSENGTTKKMAKQSLESWLSNGEIRTFLGVNRFQGVLWYDKSRLAMLCDWMLVAATVEVLFKTAEIGELTDAEVDRAPDIDSEKTVDKTEETHSPDPLAAQKRIVQYFDIVSMIFEADEIAGYKLDALLEGI